MSEEKNEVMATNFDENEVKPLKRKKYDHLAVRPETFRQFRELKGSQADNAFILELLNVYRMRLAYLEKKKAQEAQNV